MDPSPKRRKLSSGNYENASSPVDAAAAAKAENNTDSKPEQRRSLFVRSLPASVTSERLTEYFSESFPLKHATVVVDPQTKISRGFGFVTFADAEDAQAAIAQFHDSTLDGRKIKVELAAARHRDNEEAGGIGQPAPGGGKKSGPNTTAVALRAEREKTREDGQAPKLIVRNLPWSISTADDLAALFRSYGKVKHAVVPKKGPRVQYGFGFVMLRGKKNAEKALAGVNGKEVDGRTLAVDWAVDKETWEELQQKGNENNVPSTGTETADKDSAVINGAEAGSDDGDEDADAADDASDSSGAFDDVGVNEFEENDDDDDDASELELEPPPQENKNDTTIFIRNVPFTTDDDALREHFATFGPVRYARVVYDHETERSKGTGFVCFFNVEDAKACVIGAPKHEIPTDNNGGDKKNRRGEAVKHSILENEASDPSGRYTLEGRVLQVSRALSREDAEARATEASDRRDVRDRDKRRLYLLSEGSVARDSKLYDQLGKAEIDMREASARQRQRLLKTNPNLCLSLTRLSVRNVPRSIDGKALKALARQAVVGFAKDVKTGIRQPLSKEELSRGGEEMREAERRRKFAGKGIVKQAKVVFEDKQGSKVQDGSGRSRGYGFVEYASHRNALAGLRWLNGHSVKVGGGAGDGERSKRLIVEFAIENAQVLQRRSERERKFRESGGFNKGPKDKEEKDGKKGGRKDDKKNKKRKRNDDRGDDKKPAPVEEAKPLGEEDKNRLAKRNRIIAKKRQARKTRKG